MKHTADEPGNAGSAFSPAACQCFSVSRQYLQWSTAAISEINPSAQKLLALTLFTQVTRGWIKLSICPQGKVWCEPVKLESPWNESHKSQVNQSSLPWEAPQWLKVGNVFTSPSYFRELVILHGNRSMLKHAHRTLSLMADLHVSALTRKGANDACILSFVCNSKPLFSPFCFRKL